jgi:hypothetical protein
MTVIVGLAHEGAVYMGGDSAGVAGLDLSMRRDTKVFTRDAYVIGFTDSFRMGQVLQYSTELPTPPVAQRELHGFMVRDFIDAVRESLGDAGWSTNHGGRETGGAFLVGVRGRLFEICSDYQVGETLSGWNAVGCGGSLALGSLHSTGRMAATWGLHPKYRVRAALEAADYGSAGVSKPFKIVVGGHRG